MKKIRLLLAAFAAMVGLGASAQTDAQYEAANASIEAGGSYRVFTYFDGTETGTTKYYLTAAGYLTDDQASAGTFEFIQTTTGDLLKNPGWKFSQCFTNPDLTNKSTGDVVKNHHLKTNVGQNRTNWEGQIWYLNDEGLYAVRATNANAANWGANTYWCVDADATSDGLPEADYALTAAYVWQLEAILVYDEYNTTKAALQALAAQDGYTGGETAKANLNAAIAAQDEAVAAATKQSQVTAAIAALRVAAANFISAEDVNVTSALDLTNLWITTPAPYASTKGWTVSGGNVTLDSGNQCAEFWNASGASISQTITTLPKGYYVLTAIAFTRAAGSANGYTFTDMEATLSAGAASMNIAVVAPTVVTNRAAAKTWFDAGNGVNELPFSLDETTDVTISLTADNAQHDYWMVWRSFKLMYYADPLAASKEALANAVAAAGEVVEGSIPAGAYAALQTVVSDNNKEYVTEEEYATAINAITTAVDNAKAMVAPYAAFNAKVANATFVGVDATEQSTAVANATTAADIEAAIAALEAAISEAAFNITDFTITNPNPIANKAMADGWEGETFGDASNGVSEYWNKQGADFHQTVKDLPAGKYRLTVVALQRTGRTGTVYAGENRTTIAQVASTIANSRSDAATWFNAGNGRNYVYFELTEISDVVIGLTTDAVTADRKSVV